ncbi:DUF937 domain-containing protein [Rhizobium sp. LjRoot30]|uniref:DUF937 domain-containing protein n=1 Tax=Rhizobium sp. LjRoot30 TaxID=3342320 RepID=UPI003ECE5BD3
MLPLFDMMMRAQNGAAMEAMAGQFNLAQEQAAKAMAALMPAFSSGLKRSSTNPYDFSALMQAAASGNYARYFEDMSKAFTPQGIADGNTILGQIFGSKDVSRAIAAQVAQMTGVGQEVLKQMLPAMADMLMGGILKQSTGQMPGTNPFANTPMAGMMQQWLETTGMVPKSKPEPQASIFDNPFTQAMQAMFAAPKAEQPQPAANPFADNPFAKAFQDMMAAGFTGTAAAPKPETAKPQAPPEQSQFSDMLNAMFDSGLEVQKSYQKSLESIFETYRPAGDDAAAKKPSND